MYIHHTVLKRQLAQWIQVKSLKICSSQQLKILKDMFVVRVFKCNIAYQLDDDEFVSKCN